MIVCVLTYHLQNTSLIIPKRKMCDATHSPTLAGWLVSFLAGLAIPKEKKERKEALPSGDLPQEMITPHSEKG